MQKQLQGLELVATAILACQKTGEVIFANSSAENLLDVKGHHYSIEQIAQCFSSALEFNRLFNSAFDDPFDVKRQVFELLRPNGLPEHIHVTVSIPEVGGTFAIVEFREIEQQLKIDREARMLDQTLANKELIRNLAHEIKNPLGGIRGAAQLLETELNDDDLKEYTQVIIKESDRLQTLVDRLLAPHRRPHIVAPMNIHEVCERVRSVILAEYPKGLKVWRDYDTSIPELMADLEQLIQVVLNIVRNGAQALKDKIAAGDASIVLRTRVVRRVTLNRQQHRLALELQVEDNGPGVPPAIIERIFYPLVSGRENGSGLGLTLAQTFVQQHGGVIDCQSVPGKTLFRITLPLVMA